MVLTLLHSQAYLKALAAACARHPAPVVAQFHDGGPVLPGDENCKDVVFEIVAEGSLPVEEPGLVLTLWKQQVGFRFEVYRGLLHPIPSQRCPDCAAHKMLMDGLVEGVIWQEGVTWRVRPLNDQETAGREMIRGD